jgi:hypothetical protein
MKLTDLDAYVDHFRMRVLQDALNEATAAYWLKRAKTFESAAPGGYVYTADVKRHVPSCSRRKLDCACPVVHHRGERKLDFPGATPSQSRAAELALACRHKAALALGAFPDRDVDVEKIICPTCGTPTSPWSCSCGETRVGGGLSDVG